MIGLDDKNPFQTGVLLINWSLVRSLHGPPIFKPANQTTSVDVFFRGRPPLRPLARELLRFAREVACPPRLAKRAATDREGSIAGSIAVRSPCTLI